MKPDAIFLNEAIENLDVMRTVLRALDAGDRAPEQIQTLFRCAHSVKGGAAAFDLDAVAELMHLVESVLDPLRRARAPMDPLSTPLLREAVDAARSHLSGATVGARQAPNLVRRLHMLLREPVAQDAGHVRQILIRASESASPETVDAVAAMFRDIAGLGEILSSRRGDADAQVFVVRSAAPDHELLDLIAMHVERDSIAIRPITGADAPDPTSEVRHDMSQCAPGALGVAPGLVPLRERAGASGQGGASQEDVMASPSDTAAAAASARVPSELQVAPASLLFARLPPLLEHLSARLHKPLQLVMVGQDLRIDRNLLQATADPLVQLVRNACDHGIESVDTRAAAGKPPAGQIHVSARVEHDLFQLSVRDDGAGLSRQQLLQAAHSHAIAVADDIDDQHLWQLVFAPGLSTAAEVSDVSGRGVGMDVVRTRVSALGGEVTIESSTGVGTCVTISVPMGVAPSPRAETIR